MSINFSKATPFLSDNPFFKPISENDWQGLPPTRTSTLFRYSKKFIESISLFKTLIWGWFALKVLHAITSLSKHAIGFNPAFIKPVVNPPAPEKILTNDICRLVRFFRKKL